ncbi:hypothetical protein [Paramixta manurensis]|uniref:hypothetical protein n=1 Tax=Paramixta manurensis TaxID=2740817 RepID=UPI00156BAB21
MAIKEEALLQSGFSAKDIRVIRNNVESYGGSLDEAIQDLARRFLLLVCVVTGCLAVFLVLAVFSSTDHVISGGVALLAGVVIALYSQPPLLSYKSWRYRRASRRTGN